MNEHIADGDRTKQAEMPLQRHPIRRIGARVHHLMDRWMPHTPWIDGGFRTLRFLQANRRLPRRSGDATATFNDFILERMICDDWTSLERVCIDKQYAKLLAAAMCPSVKVSRTELIIPLGHEDGGVRAFRALASRSGRGEVAKPTHGSGTVLFLRGAPSPAAILAFCETASQSYHRSSRESQYKGLARKIIVEEDLSAGGSVPDDFKFFCSHGEVLFCQVDVDRFTRHRRRLVTPEFEPIGVRFAYDWPEKPPLKPRNFGEMLRIAQELSRLFRFVRIDLYSVGNEVYFGEFTFAPEGAAGALSSEAFGIGVMEKIRKSMWNRELDA